MWCSNLLRIRKWSKVRSFLRATLPAAALAIPTVRWAEAAPITWIGGNADWSASNVNWNPADEPDANDEAIFNTPDTVNLANPVDTIMGLTMSGGINLNTNVNDLTVDGLVQLVDASTTLIISGSTSLFAADSVTINSGGTINLRGGILVVAEEAGNGLLTVSTGGTLAGNGTIIFTEFVAAGTVLLQLDGGTLFASSTVTGLDPFGINAATLNITVPDVNGRIDLDSLGSVVTISRNDTLDINGQSHGPADPYSGTMNLSEGSMLDTSAAWEMDSGDDQRQHRFPDRRRGGRGRHHPRPSIYHVGRHDRP